jgi:WD40 repeat protein
MQGHKNAILELHWSDNCERIVTASPDKTVRAWDIAQGVQVKKMGEHNDVVNSCHLLRRGSPLVVSGSEDQCIKVIFCHDVAISCNCTRPRSIHLLKRKGSQENMQKYGDALFAPVGRFCAGLGPEGQAQCPNTGRCVPNFERLPQPCRRPDFLVKHRQCGQGVPPASL